MKYYGFKFRKFGAEKSKLNRHVSTWIGLVGTFIFLTSVAELGGFKGRMGGELWFTTFYPASLWLISLFGIEYNWPRVAIIVLTFIGTLFFLATNLLLWFYNDRLIASLVMLLIFNLGALVLAFRKDSAKLNTNKS